MPFFIVYASMLACKILPELDQYGLIIIMYINGI